MMRLSDYIVCTAILDVSPDIDKEQMLRILVSRLVEAGREPVIRKQKPAPCITITCS